ncbi:hypothetical protein L9F63_015834, partial [Diploptera punctata]
ALCLYEDASFCTFSLPHIHQSEQKFHVPTGRPQFPIATRRIPKGSEDIEKNG